MENQMKSAATLRIVGDDLVPEEVTRLLRCEPTRAEHKGSVVREKSTRREHLARTGSWYLEVADRAPDDLDGQIMEIVGRLNEDPEVWASLARRFRLDVFCGLFMATSGEGLSLSPAALLALGTRQLKLDLCLYGPIEQTDSGTAQ